MADPVGQNSLRRRILTFVFALVALSLLGSTLTLYRITEVNGLLEDINRVSVPLGRIFTQTLADADVFQREFEKNLGQSHWKDPHWKARPLPRWIQDVLGNEIDRARELLNAGARWMDPDANARWADWSRSVNDGFISLRDNSGRLFTALEQNNGADAVQHYQKWTTEIEEWKRQLQWGGSEYERALRQTFSLAQTRVSELRTGLEMVLVGVVLLSLLLLWLGERALRPLNELTRLAREITRRGLRREDKALLPEIFMARSDEVSQLAKEFHHMATALLEREKVVETQKHRVQEQNRMLREMGELNQNILNSIESVLIVTDLNGKITQCNPEALRWLGCSAESLIGSDLLAWEKLSHLFPQAVADLLGRERKVGPFTVEGRVYGGHLMPLRREDSEAHGAIVVLDDLTDEMDLQERLRRAENLAAVGRMSAQVAHEVRNPLHSIGLEAEVAAEMASKIGHPSLKQSLQSILGGVDRLEKITENYLKLSRLSTGEKTSIDIGELLEAVLATYAPVCEAQGVRVDWRRLGSSPLKVWGDRDLLEQVLGNLFRNSLQALDGMAAPQICWMMGEAESGRVWVKIEDNGPGISPEIRDKLFTPFVTTRAQGTGLGLSFIKKVLEDHGGSITCVDRPAGQGASFEIALPADVAANRGISRNPGMEMTT